MSDNIDIVVREQGTKQAADGMRTLAASSLKAADNVNRLNKEMRGLKLGSRVVNDMQKTMEMAKKLVGQNNALAASSAKLSTALLRVNEAEARMAVNRQRLATESAKTQRALAMVEAEMQKAIAAATKSTIADTQLAASKVKLGQETTKLGALQTRNAIEVQRLVEQTNKATTAQQRLTTEQQRTVEAMNKASVAQQNLTNAQTNGALIAARLTTEQGRAQIAATMAAVAQQNLAAATSRAQAAATGAVTATANLATAQERTKVAAAQAAAASDRAAIAALRLSEAQKKVSQSSRMASTSLGDYAKQVAAAAGAGLGVIGLGKMADGYTTLNNKLVNLAPDQVTVNKLMNEMFDLANRTRQPVEETTKAFQRFDNAMKDMGASQEESLRMTETVNKAIIVSGASASESAAGLLQLAQAFGSGRLQGDEFRSIMENMPVLADMIAKSMGKTRSELKQLSTEGKITSAVMRKAFAEAAVEIDEKFGKTVPTMSQAFNVLRNNTMRFTGQLDQALGITRGISQGMLWLADNMKAVALATVAVGAAMTVVYGPGLVSMLGKARVAMLALNAATLANPVLALAAVLVTLAAAVMLFGNQVKVSADGFVTLKDLAVGTFNLIKDAATTAAKWIGEKFDALVGVVAGMTGGWATDFSSAMDVIGNLLKANANNMIGTFVGAYNAIKLLWNNAPQLFKDIFANIVNYGAEAVEKLSGSFVSGLKSIASGVKGIAPETAAAIEGALDGLKLELPRMEVGKGVKDTIAEVGKEYKAAFNTDYVGKAGDTLMEAARAAAKVRTDAADAEAKAQLRAAGASRNAPAEQTKAELKRAASLAKVNAELDNEIARMGMLKPMREDQARFDKIEESMLGKKIKLTADETKALKDKIAVVRQSIEVQGHMDSIYEASIGPQRDYNQGTQAAKQLLDQGAISLEQYQKAMVLATESYISAVDPLYQFNKALAEQQHLNSFNPGGREVEAEMLNLTNQLLGQGIVLTDQQTSKIREQLVAQQQQNQLTVARDAIWANSVGVASDLLAMQEALNMAYSNGAITQTYYAAQMAQTNIKMAEMQNMLGNGDVFSVFTAGVGQAIQGFESLATSAADILGNVMTTAIDGISNSIAGAIVRGEDLRETLSAVGQTILTELISSLIRMGIQYMINATMASSALGIQTAASVAAAVTTAAAWAPAAAAVSLATLGTNSAPAVMGMSAANVAAKSFALAGFQTGGYTGDAAVNKAAGIVHGQEFVMNAAATKRIGVDNLQAMQDGDMSGITQVQRTEASPSRGMPSINVVNNGTPQDYEVDSWSEDEIRLIASDVADKRVKAGAGRAVAKDLRNPNSAASKSFGTNTMTKRRR